MTFLLIGYEGHKYLHHPTSWGAAAYVDDGYLVNGITGFRMKYDPANISGGSALTIFSPPLRIRVRPAVVVEMSATHANAVGLLAGYAGNADGWRSIGEDETVFYFASSASAKAWRLAAAAKLSALSEATYRAAVCLDHRLYKPQMEK